MALNEKTSEPVASIAGRILEMKNPGLITNDFWKQIQSVAASALTQAPDKEKSLADYFTDDEKSIKAQPFSAQFFSGLKNLKK